MVTLFKKPNTIIKLIIPWGTEVMSVLIRNFCLRKLSWLNDTIGRTEITSHDILSQVDSDIRCCTLALLNTLRWWVKRYWNYRSFIYPPTDALVSYRKKQVLTFTLKYTLKQLRHVSVLQLHHHFNSCNFSKHELMRSLMMV